MNYMIYRDRGSNRKKQREIHHHYFRWISFFLYFVGLHRVTRMYVIYIYTCTHAYMYFTQISIFLKLLYFCWVYYIILYLVFDVLLQYILYILGSFIKLYFGTFLILIFILLYFIIFYYIVYIFFMSNCCILFHLIVFQTIIP